MLPCALKIGNKNFQKLVSQLDYNNEIKNDKQLRIKKINNYRKKYNYFTLKNSF